MPRLEARGLRKRFGETVALDGADLRIEPGEVHALLGENGAGKSTLVRALFGIVRPDAGEIRLHDEAVAIRGPRAALELGIGLVPQHPMLVPSLSVAENLMLGEPGGWLSRAALERQTAQVMRVVGLDLPPDRPAGELPISQQQRLEIGRALARGVELLVLDEPTAVLAPSEVEDLLALLGRLRATGRSVLFISHKLEEITSVCDRVTVLRHGRSVATRAVAGTGASELGLLMVGEAPPPPRTPPAGRRGDVALRLDGVVAEGLAPLDLEVAAGEIVAIAGVEGNGQAALEEGLAGVRPLEAGRIEGSVALLPGDRQRTGLVLDLSVQENLVLCDAAASRPRARTPAPSAFAGGLLRPWLRRRRAVEAIARFAIRGTPRAAARTLSGGNQQKLCVARALVGHPLALVAINPTRGLDVRATAAVREALRDEVRAGAAVLLVSTDLDEVLELANRIAVIFRGRLFPVLPGERSRTRIGELMLGRGEAA